MSTNRTSEETAEREALALLGLTPGSSWLQPGQGMPRPTLLSADVEATAADPSTEKARAFVEVLGDTLRLAQDIEEHADPTLQAIARALVRAANEHLAAIKTAFPQMDAARDPHARM